MSYLIYLYAAASCLSIAATNGILALFTIIFLKRSYDARKTAGSADDFRLFGGVYGWKGITLIANGLWTKVYRIRELWDKMPCLVLSRAGVKKSTLETAAHVLFATNSLLVVWAILQKYFNWPFICQPLNDHGYGRMLGYFGNSMHYSGYMDIVMLFSLALALFYRRRFGVYFPVLLGGLILSGQRTYYIAAVAGILLLVALKSRKALLITLVILPVTVFIAYMNSPLVHGRVSSILSERAIGIRAAYWPVAWRAFLENPVFGVGYEEFTPYLQPYVDKGLVDNTAHAHNLYLQELAEGGVIGFVIIVATFGWFIRKYYLCFMESEDPLLKSFAVGICASYASLAVGGLTEYNFGAAVIWLLLTFLMGLTASYKKEIEGV